MMSESPVPPEHMFQDINKFMNDTVLKNAGNINRFSYDDFMKLMSKTKFCNTFSHCIICGGQCQLERSDLHIGGTPCVDFSPMSNSRAALQGDNLCCLMVWIFLVLKLQHNLVLHENVVGFDIRPFESLMSHQFPFLICH